LSEIAIRFLIGGLFVSAFAILGDSLKPKSFAGLFGAAPPIALATLSLTIQHEGVTFAAAEARTMSFDAIAFLIYACGVCWVIMRFKLSAYVAATAFVLVLAGRGARLQLCPWLDDDQNRSIAMAPDQVS
jgi:hypothetical protein